MGAKGDIPAFLTQDVSGGQNVGKAHVRRTLGGPSFSDILSPADTLCQKCGDIPLRVPPLRGYYYTIILLLLLYNVKLLLCNNMR